MDAIEAILTRRSVRAYANVPVTDQQLETLLRCAMAAPSTVDNRDWAFIVVRDREILSRIEANQEGNAHMLSTAPCAIVACGDLNLAHKPDIDYWMQDVSAATENIIIAANAMGLGTCWLGTYPVRRRVEGLQKILNLPEHIVPLAVLSVGTPARKPGKKDAYEPQKVRYEKW